MAKSGAIAVGAFVMALGVALGACTSEAEHAARASTTLTPVMRQAASEATRSGAHIYRMDAMVLDGLPVGMELQRRGPEICTGGVAASLPPQCGGTPIVGWDWSAVSGEESRSGVTWGDFHLVGTYDSDRNTFTLTEPPARPKGMDRTSVIDVGDRPDPPCRTPEGGWRAVDSSKATSADGGRLSFVVQHSTDYAYIARFPDQRPGWTVGFTGDPAVHEAQLRAFWGGPLCVIQLPNKVAELTGAQDRMLRDSQAGRLDQVHVTGFGTSPLQGAAWISVIWAPPDFEDRLEDRYGVPVLVDRYFDH
jgi:hypothetical protein